MRGVAAAGWAMLCYAVRGWLRGGHWGDQRGWAGNKRETAKKLQFDKDVSTTMRRKLIPEYRIPMSVDW